MNRQDRFRLLSLQGVMIICGVLLLLTFAFPFIEDNIPQAYIAQRWLQGEMPYVGTWDQNYPGIILFHAVALLWSPSVLAFHIVDVILELCVVWSLYKIGNRISGNAAGFFAALFYTIYYVLNGSDDLFGQKDVFAAAMIIMALWSLIRSNYRANIVPAILLGIAVLVRPTYGLHLLIFLMIYVAKTREHRLLRSTQFLLVASIPMLIFCVVYGIAGHLEEFWKATFIFTTSVYNPRPRFGILFSPSLYFGFLPVLSFIGLFLLLRNTKSRFDGIFLFFLLYASLTSTMLLWGYRYHWQPFFVFEQLLAGVGIASLIHFIFDTFFKRPLLKDIAYSMAALTIVIVDIRGTTMGRLLKDTAYGQVHSMDTVHAYFANPAFDPVGEENLANYINRKKHTGDRMESFYTTVYPQYIADLQPANRFILTIPLVMRNAREEFTPMQKAWQKEYSDSLLSVRPRWFLISDPKDTTGIGEGGRLPRQMLHETFPLVEEMVNMQYHSDTVIGIWTLYERN